MPIDTTKLACTTGFQNNCGLNALAHTIAGNLANPNIPANAKTALATAFRTYYGLTKEEAEEGAILKSLGEIQNPVHLEVVLGPVLRSMLQDILKPKGSEAPTPLFEQTKGSGPLGAEHIQYLAAQFNIAVAVYEPSDLDKDVFEEGRATFVKDKLLAEAECIALKLYHTTKPNHWTYEWASDLKTTEEKLELFKHNACYNAYQSKGFQYDAAMHLEKLKQAVSAAFKPVVQPATASSATASAASSPDLVVNLNKVLTDFEATNPPKDINFSLDKMFDTYNQAKSKVKEMFPNSGILPILDGIGQFMMGILAPLMQMFKVFGEMFPPQAAGVADATNAASSSTTGTQSDADLTKKFQSAQAAASSGNDTTAESNMPNTVLYQQIMQQMQAAARAAEAAARAAEAAARAAEAAARAAAAAA